MRIISTKPIREFQKKHSDSRVALDDFVQIVQKAHWKSLADLRATFPHADPVTVKSGRTMTVFNVKGKKYRMIVGIDYEIGIFYIKAILTHDEYSKDKWKESL